jgi:protein-S-isoprenylcysteine O-methyltransferase Ste14
MNTNIMRRLIQVFLTLFMQGLLLFAFAGTLHWTWAWIFLILNVGILLINLSVLPRELIEERGRPKPDAKKWDKTLSSVNIIPTVLLYVCAGLDYRFGWTGGVASSINIMGLILVFLGAMLFTWAMISNRFFSTLVRLQRDRQHTVATGGPYKYVRHPGYAGYIVMTLATPLALGTLWPLVFSAVSCVLIVLRTALEDDTLKKELEGYAEYAETVKYRLIPLLW